MSAVAFVEPSGIPVHVAAELIKSQRPQPLQVVTYFEAEKAIRERGPKRP